MKNILLLFSINVIISFFVGCSKNTNYFKDLRETDNTSDIVRQKELRSFRDYSDRDYWDKDWEKSPPRYINDLEI